MAGRQDMSNHIGVDLQAQPTKPGTTNFVRESFTSNFWMSGLAILKYIPHSFRVKQVDGNAFFTEEKRDEFRDRILRVAPINPRQWGTMTVAQMLHHLNLSSGGSLGFYDLPDESYFVLRTVFRWILVDWFPEQPVGLRLPKGFKIAHDAQFDFDFENQRLLKILDAAWRARSAADWGPHPMFGKMTAVEWGKLLQIHIDYHMKQFAA
jgi:hypothetical protein